MMPKKNCCRRCDRGCDQPRFPVACPKKNKRDNAAKKEIQPSAQCERTQIDEEANQPYNKAEH
jgi:hypothetical protein